MGMAFNILSNKTFFIYLSFQAWLNIDIVDVNNHDPKFLQTIYYFNIKENDLTAEVGQLIGQVLAIDDDRGFNSIVEYYISTSSAHDIFSIVDVSI